MRFLLVLLAMLSGLSLADVAVAASPAEVVGVARQAAAETAPAAVLCPVRARHAMPPQRVELARPLPLDEEVFATSCGTTVADHPHE
ncbi:hypothetical protein Y88_0734 [Novosphingobium nitrogenifigens DSM 19370]|uniref:Uncharacterized protein n=1 Tax=Novosphingobium nitrogenifigens DSM 19370 TaxID=983920 RepID=F1Z9R5_9SPHN|nr:hypothetical protein [Novosphingobium nitrogenifigens]EGD58677.1 hypothetical protein Y88_0734 [Novosphingobium nitrogenifigens DSM 19370]